MLFVFNQPPGTPSALEAREEARLGQFVVWQFSASFPPQSGGVLKGWKKFIKHILLSTLGLALALSIWRMLIKPRLIDVEVDMDEQSFARCRTNRLRSSA